MVVISRCLVAKAKSRELILKVIMKKTKLTTQIIIMISKQLIWDIIPKHLSPTSEKVILSHI